MLGVREPSSKLVATLDGLMGEAIQCCATATPLPSAPPQAEEERFAETLDSGMRIFGEVASRSGDTSPGVDAFRCTTPTASRST